MIVFSILTFFYQGNQAYAHGFKKEEAQQIKQAIDRGKAKAKITTINHNYVMPNPVAQPTVTPVENRGTETSSYSEPVSTLNRASPVASKGNDNMYSDQLETLIEFALTDGELTDKERQILNKKAQADGIDLDEFEMVLEARLYKIKKLNNNTVTNSQPPETIITQPKSDKLGDYKKCPSCGASAQSYSTKCSDCGHDFTGIGANSSAKKLFDMLNEIESHRSSTDGTSIKAAFGSMLTKSMGLGVGDRINNQKKELISNFPVPNTKEDIIEFLSLAIPRATKQGNFFTSGSFNTPANERNKIHNEFAPIWKAKCQQIIMKAHFLMKDDKRTLDEINHYANQLNAN
jgi:hypothetical protein